ncbi:hypothetical protein ACP4OV_002088 [Aristida adscensionis]
MAHMSVEKIITVGLAIKEAAETARRNKRECRDIERSVARVGALLSVLHSSSATAAAAMRHPALSGPLEDLAESVEEALELVAGCRETGALRRFLAAEGMAKKLRRVQEDVLRKMMLGTFATTTLMSMTLASNAAAPSGGGRHDGTADQHLLPCARAQDAEQVGISDISTDDARAGVSCDCDTTSIIAATASEVPYAPSSMEQITAVLQRRALTPILPLYRATPLPGPLHHRPPLWHGCCHSNSWSGKHWPAPTQAWSVSSYSPRMYGHF